MIKSIFQGGSRAEGGGSSLANPLILLGGRQGRKGGSSCAKSLITLRAEAEGKPYTTYRPAAFGAARLRISSPRFMAAL